MSKFDKILSCPICKRNYLCPACRKFAHTYIEEYKPETLWIERIKGLWQHSLEEMLLIHPVCLQRAIELLGRQTRNPYHIKKIEYAILFHELLHKSAEKKLEKKESNYIEETIIDKLRFGLEMWKE